MIKCTFKGSKKIASLIRITLASYGNGRMNGSVNFFSDAVLSEVIVVSFDEPADSIETFVSKSLHIEL